jgi:hypothetical protein
MARYIFNSSKRTRDADHLPLLAFLKKLIVKRKLAGHNGEPRHRIRYRDDCPRA